MDPLHLCIALTPLAAYLLVVAVVNFRKRPLVINGYRDGMALGLGLIGFAIAGPLELFLPESAAFRLGWYVWPLLIALYLLLVLLAVLMSRPRLVIYNLDSDELRPVLSEVVRAMDAQARWAGDSLALPSRGVQLYLERHRNMRTVELVASPAEQDLQSWGQLERNLRQQLSSIKTVTSRSRAVRSAAAPQLMLLTAVAMLLMLAVSVIRDHQAIVAGLYEMLRW